MNVVVAIDSMKGSLSSSEAGNAIKEGILRAIPHAEVTVCPVADGGEGTMDALVKAMGGRFEKVSVADPLGRPIVAQYGIVDKRRLAVIEMACAAGLTLLNEQERDPMNTTTKGVGQIICDAIRKGCRNFLIGIGGSATNDGGVGMLSALGFEFLDKDGQPIPEGAKGLAVLDRICQNRVVSELSECTFRVACDVKNPLCGKTGCSAVFAPQKGATVADVFKMDAWLRNYARITKENIPCADDTAQGAGAAGGLGFAFQSYLGASLEPGIHIVLDEIALEEQIIKSDIVVTGEGCLDGQSAFGKTPIGVAALAKKHGKTVLAFAGSVSSEAKICNEYGIDAYFSILQRIATLQEAMEPQNAYGNLRDTAEQVFRMIGIIQR